PFLRFQPSQPDPSMPRHYKPFSPSEKTCFRPAMLDAPGLHLYCCTVMVDCTDNNEWAATMSKPRAKAKPAKPSGRIVLIRDGQLLSSATPPRLAQGR